MSAHARSVSFSVHRASVEVRRSEIGTERLRTAATASRSGGKPPGVPHHLPQSLQLSGAVQSDEGSDCMSPVASLQQSPSASQSYDKWGAAPETNLGPACTTAGDGENHPHQRGRDHPAGRVPRGRDSNLEPAWHSAVRSVVGQQAPEREMSRSWRPVLGFANEQ